MKNKFIKAFFFIFLFFLIAIIFFLSIKTKNIINNIKNTGHVAVINKEDLIFEDPRELKYFYEYKPNTRRIIKPSFLAYEVLHQSNSDSLREEKDYSIPKKDRVYRIITLGDSHTYGLNVMIEETYPKQLERKLNKELNCRNIDNFEVINLGTAGYDIEYAAERFKKRGRKYQPDLVLWYINYWNFEYVPELIGPVEEEYKKNGIPKYDPFKLRFDQRKNATSLATQDIFNKYGQEKLTLYEANSFQRLNPEDYNNLLIFSNKDINNEYKSVLENYASSSSNLKYALLISPLSEDMKLPDEHPNSKGYQRIAKEIFNYLTKNYLTWCHSN